MPQQERQLQNLQMQNYKLQRFGRGGFVAAALRTSPPIIPVAIVGAEETYPMVGNYGVPDMQVLDEFGLPRFFESDRIQVSGLIVQQYNDDHSHWNSNSSLGDWLASQGIPALHGIDTRALTKRIRDNGAVLAKIEFDGVPTCVGGL